MLLAWCCCGIRHVKGREFESFVETKDAKSQFAFIISSVSRFGDFWTLGNFLKPLAGINLPKSPSFLCKFYKGINFFHFSCEIIFGQLL